jgi:hypothetical protein
MTNMTERGSEAANIVSISISHQNRMIRFSLVISNKYQVHNVTHKIFIHLIAANKVLDVTAIAIWIALLANTWNGMYWLDSWFVQKCLGCVFGATLLGENKVNVLLFPSTW